MENSSTRDATREADALRARIAAAIDALDADAAIAHSMEALDSGLVTIDELHAHVLSRVLCDLGGGWQAGEIEVWQEHFSSAVVRTIIEVAHPHVVAGAAKAADSRGTAVLACPMGEQHDLGLRMLADRLRVSGWRVYFLGADTPTAEIAAAAKATGASLIVLSAATHFNRVQMRQAIDRLRALVPDCRVGVGGPAFAHDPEWDASDLLSEKDLGLDSSACECEER